MSPTSQVGQDAAVAVLQAQQVTLEASVRELASTVATGFASINAKMDRMNDIAMALATLTTQHESYREGLSRAFGEIEGVKRTADSLFDDAQAWRSKHTEVHTGINHRLSVAKGVVLGLTACAAIVVSLVTWAASSYIGDTRENTRAIHNIELEMARRLPGKLP